MGLSLLIIGLVSAAVSVKQTLDEKKAVQAKAKVDARIERRNAVQQQVDIQHNAGVEQENRKETVMEAGFQRQQLMKQARRQRASTATQMQRQGLTAGSPSLDAVLQDQMMDESLALQDIKSKEMSENVNSRGRERTLNRDAFAVREIGETNAQAITLAGKNAAHSLGLQAIGQGLSGVSGAVSQYKS